MEGVRETNVNASSEGTTLEQLFLMLRRRWFLVVACVVLVAGAAIAFSLVQRTEYTASASLLFSNTQFDQELFCSNFTSGAVDPTREAATNLDLVSLPTLASRTASSLHLPGDLVGNEVSVSGSGQADVARVSATDPSPARAAEIANAVADTFIHDQMEARYRTIGRATAWLQDRLNELLLAHVARHPA